jgi:hypothetical protein
MLALGAAAAAGAQEVKPDEVTLEWHGHTLRPVRAVSPALPEVPAGPVLLAIDEKEITAFDPATHQQRWTAVVPDGMAFQLLAANDEQAYFVNRPRVPADGVFMVWRLVLKSGQWLHSLGTPGEPGANVVIQAETRANRLFVLSSPVAAGPMDPTATAEKKSYRVTCFDTASGEQKWAKAFPMAEEPGNPGPFLLSARQPNSAAPAIRALSWLGNDLLVCAGPHQALVCVGADNGGTRWTLERIWEFQRNFIGPSVWQHYIDRFVGAGPAFRPMNAPPPDLSDARKKFDAQWQCEIIGGPAVVMVPAAGRQPAMPRIFVVVAKGPAAGYSAQLADAVAYEVGTGGGVVSLANLPRLVNGGQFHALGDAVTWCAQNGAMIQLQAHTGDAGFGMGPGGYDCVTKVAWYREFGADDPPGVWLVADKAGDPTAFGGDRIYRQLAGGYVSKPADKLYHFPLVAMGYDGTATEPLLLNVPLTDTVPVPTGNFSRSGQTWHKMGAYLVGITSLRAEGKRLFVTLGMEDSAVELAFDLTDAK